VHDEEKVCSLPDKDRPHIFLFRPVKDFSSGIPDHRFKSGPVIHFRSSFQHIRTRLISSCSLFFLINYRTIVIRMTMNYGDFIAMGSGMVMP
jgi:hypothetical protein